MNFTLRFFLAVAFLCGTAALGADDKDPRADMHEMAKEITALQKFMLTDTEFSSPKNEAAIKKSLGSLQSHLAHLGKESFGNDPSMKVNLSLLQSHVNDATRAFQTNSKPFARYMLQSSLQMCIACHTRRKAADFSWPEPEAGQIANLDRADYYFATRQFSKGRELYEGIVGGYPGNKEPQWNVRRAMLSLAVYYARVSEDPKAASDYFAKAGENKDLPAYLQQECKAWSKEFGDWAKEPKAKEGAKESESVLLAKAKKLLRHDDFTLVSEVGRSFHVRRLRATALLHRVLEAPGEKSPAKAQALLYLGQIYPRVSSNIFFRFGEMYLKACIQDYQKTASARSCYVALELLVTEGFTGSAGTQIPEDEQVELMRLKRLAY
jgi:hypothetical protein